MADFYAKYPASNPSSVSVTTVQGEGTAGTPVGGLLTVQGDPSGTPIPITGSISATNPSVGVIGATDPTSATYIGVNNGGNLIGALGDSSGRQIVAGAGTAGAAAGGVMTVQGSASGTAIPISGTVTVAAGSAIIGKVSIDQTTPGTTNGVQVNAALPAGTNKIGALTTVDTVTAVTTVSTVSTVSAVTAITNALPAGSNIIGNVRIDQTTPGTTNGVVVNSTTTTTAAFQAEGAVAFGSITNSYVTLFTPTAATKILQMRNNTNAAISVSMDAGSTTNYTLDSGDAVSLDLLSNALSMGATAIQVKYAVGAPTSGSFRINGCH